MIILFAVDTSSVIEENPKLPPTTTVERRKGKLPVKVVVVDAMLLIAYIHSSLARVSGG